MKPSCTTPRPLESIRDGDLVVHRSYARRHRGSSLGLFLFRPRANASLQDDFALLGSTVILGGPTLGIGVDPARQDTGSWLPDFCNTLPSNETVLAETVQWF